MQWFSYMLFSSTARASSFIVEKEILLQIIAETIDWEVLCDGSVNLQRIYARLLGPIALGFHHLANTSNLGRYAWTDDQIFILMEEISSQLIFLPLE